MKTIKRIFTLPGRKITPNRPKVGMALNIIALFVYANALMALFGLK